MQTLRFFLAFAVCVLMLSCGDNDAHLAKIKFELGDVNEEGLTGGAEGLRAISYEFCIPEDKRYEVEAIDKTLAVSRATGRVGCGTDELLCIGHTNQPNIDQVLSELAAKDYIAEIREAYFE